MAQLDLQQLSEGVIDMVERAPDKYVLREIVEKAVSLVYKEGVSDGMELSKAVIEGKV